MTPDYIVDYINQTAQNGNPKFTKWKKYVTNDGKSGYTTMLNGVEIYLTHGFTMGIAGTSAIFLTLHMDQKTTTLVEPPIHISKAPIGKLFRKITGETTDFFGSKKLWPKDPTNIKARENERFRIALNNLYVRIASQEIETVRTKTVPYAAGDNENDRQELFKKVTKI